MAARAAASRLAAAFAASRAARAGGKLLATGSGAYGLYKAGEHALTETVPYAADGSGSGGEGRRRFVPPSWLAALDNGQASGAAAELHLPRLQAGEVRVRNLSKDVFSWQQQLVQDSAQVVLTALQQEARSRPDGFGRHILEAGMHVLIKDGSHTGAVPPNVVQLDSSVLADFLKHAKDDMQAAVAALQFTLAHAMAHLYLRHELDGRPLEVDGEEHPVSGTVAFFQQLNGSFSTLASDSLFSAAPDAQRVASKLKELSWRREYEADEVACAVMAHLRLPPEQWAAGLALARAVELEGLQGWASKFVDAVKDCMPDMNVKEAEAAFRAELPALMGWPSLDAGLAQLKAAAATGNLAQLHQQHHAWSAAEQVALLAQHGAADNDSSDSLLYRYVGKAMVDSIRGLPRTAALAVLADLVDTHPPTDARIARVQHLATHLPMLQRATAPPVEVGGRFEPGSVAQLVADRAEAQRRVELAAAKAGQKRA